MRIQILDYTRNPLTTIGERSRHCYNTKLKDEGHAGRIGKSVVKDQHFRNLEFARVSLVIEGLSARCVREFYTHIGGSPTRVQSSTRYITYKEFPYYIPEGITEEQRAIYEDIMKHVQEGYGKLKETGAKNDICGYVLPLAMESTFVWEGNVRTLINMFNQRLCKRALKEYQDVMKQLKNQLAELDAEWKWIADNYFVPKCVAQNGVCYEGHGCGMFPKYEEFKPYLDEAFKQYNEDKKMGNLFE